jgi:SAM-dependent methyltransferase
MLRKLLPRKLKDYIRREIARASPPPPPLTPQAMKYFPYRWPEEAYALPLEPPPPYGVDEQDGLPVPPPELWVGYGRDTHDYLYHGKLHTEQMLDILRDDQFTLRQGQRALDFGCAAGRMIRFLKPFADACELWGVDISAAHIYWCRQYLSPPFHFLANTTIPHLPFADGYFHLIYSGSVFTHIDDLAEAWIHELRRVLAPGGRLYATIHDYHTVRLLFTKFKERGITNYLNTQPAFLENRDKFSMLSLGRDVDSQVFFHIDHFLRMATPGFKVKKVVEEAYTYQTGVLLEKDY